MIELGKALDELYELVQLITSVIGIVVVIVIILIVAIKYFLKNSKYEEYTPVETKSQEFKKIYNELYSKNKRKLDKLRKSIASKYIIFGIVLLLLFVITIRIILEIKLLDVVTFELIVVTFELIFIPFVGIISFFEVFMQKYKKKYATEYKQYIISKFVKLVNENLEYKSISTFAMSAEPEYRKANFDDKFFNRFYQDDYIEWNIKDDVNMKIFDIHIQHVGKKQEEDVFQGVFARCTSLNNIETTVKITKNKLKILDSKERIQMDSGEFEKYFDVYAEDKITAMRILTSDVMQCLIDFQNKYNLDFEIVFKNNVIYLRFFTGPMFEPKIIGDAMDEELIFRYYTILKFIIEITQTVNASKKELDI